MQAKRTVSADYVIIGGGITSALLAQKLSELKPSASIIVVEAGSPLFDNDNRFQYRQRSLDYGENQWPGDFVADQAPDGMISRTMAVGGSALIGRRLQSILGRRHAPESMQARRGLADRGRSSRRLLRGGTPHRRVGRAGRSKKTGAASRIRCPAMTPTYNLKQLKTWAEKAAFRFGRRRRRRIR